jgi:hypothetical protein
MANKYMKKYSTFLAIKEMQPSYGNNPDAL